MGRLNSRLEQQDTLTWAVSYQGTGAVLPGQVSAAELLTIFRVELHHYFALAALSRSTTAPGGMVREAQIGRAHV